MQIPPGLFDLLRLPGLGSRRVRTLWTAGGIATLRQLDRACHRGRVAHLPGFTPELQTRLHGLIRARRHGRGQWLRPAALDHAATAEAQLARTKGVRRLERAGRLRRAWGVIDELVWVAAATEPRLVLGRLATLEAAGLPAPDEPDTVRVRPADGPAQRIVVVPERHLVARRFLETGSGAHVRGVLRRLPDGTAEDWWPADEEEIYRRASLAYVPPELREGRGEIAAAAAGEMPRLLAAGDLRGALHVHTDWSDGRDSIRAVAGEARRLGWRYVGIADHSVTAFYAQGLTPRRVREQAYEVRAVQRDFPDVRILHGLECDILPDGLLDMPADVLGELDYVIASIHSPLGEDREAMTRRLIGAVGQPYVTLLGHPSGRLLLEREAYPVDFDALLDAVAERGVAIEFNARPERLDLDWRLLRRATARGIPIAINPDAHEAAGMGVVAAGLATARKGWLTPEQVMNARDLPDLLALLERCRRRGNAGGAPLSCPDSPGS